MKRNPSPRDLETTYRLFNEIGIIAQLSGNDMARVLPHNLTVSQFSVLNWFSRVDDVATPGRLARAFQVSKGAMTNTLQRLEEKGFIRVEPDPASGRRKLVRMTAAGRKAREASIVATFPVLKDFLSVFDARDIAAMLPMLEAIRSYLDERRFRT